MNAQDELYAKMAHLSSKKQEGLRQTVCQILFRHGVEDRDRCYDSILQQVIEWVELRKGKYGDQSKYDEALNDLISKLKEDK